MEIRAALDQVIAAGRTAAGQRSPASRPSAAPAQRV
jgi:hypothetical protein